MRENEKIKKACKRCGCDFPNIPVYEKGCGSCETPQEMMKRMMKQLQKLDQKK